MHILKNLHDVVGRITLRQVVVGKIGLGGGVFAIPSFHQAVKPFRKVLRKTHLPRAQGLKRARVTVLLVRCVSLSG